MIIIGFHVVLEHIDASNTDAGSFGWSLQSDLVSCCNFLQFYRVKLQISISITVYLWELLEGEMILLLEFRTRGFAAV